MKSLEVTNLSFIPNIILSACVLHNFILDVEGDRSDSENDSQSETSDGSLEEYIDDENDEVEAVAKRNRIALSL